jgi:predicted NAD/FAD-dependent oxidoreductase
MAEGDNMMAHVMQLTDAERKMIAKAREKQGRAAAKRIEQKALTGQRADYPSLSHQWSSEVAFNMVESVRSRMVVFMWKKLPWQARVKEALAVVYPKARWKNNQRWLAMLLGKEVASLWGHLGAMRQQLHAPVGVALM